MKTLVKNVGSTDLAVNVRAIFINACMVGVVFALSYSLVNISYANLGANIVGVKSLALSSIIVVTYNVISLAIDKNKTVIFNIALIAAFFFLSDLIPLESFNAMYLDKFELVGMLSAPFIIIAGFFKRLFA